MTNSVLSIELDINQQFTFTKGFQGLQWYNNDNCDEMGPSSNPKNNPSFESILQYTDQRHDLVKKFDLRSRLDLKWIYKTANVKNFKNQAEKIKKRRAKKIKIDNEEIEKNIDKGEYWCYQ